MIRIQRRRSAIDLHRDFTGNGLHNKLVKLVEARIVHGQKMAFEGALGDWKKTKKSLKGESFGKCAFCESDTEKVAHGDVEHFRPKSIYWWLALCVDNFVFCCQICNQSYKGNNFPVTGKVLSAPRIPKRLPTREAVLRSLTLRISPDPALVDENTLLSTWFNEKASLPHPYLLDPEPLLAWAVSEVNKEVHVVAPQNANLASRRAVKAVSECFGLNRETLTRSRYLVYQNVIFALQVWGSASKSKKAKAANRVRELCDSTQQYAGMSRYFARQCGFPL